MNYIGTLPFLDLTYGPPVPPPVTHIICTTGHWLNPNEEWQVFNNTAPSTYQQISIPNVHVPQIEPESSQLSCGVTENVVSINPHLEPIWKRRGANPVPPLKLDVFIRGDLNWTDKAFDDDLLEIVHDSEWKSLQPDYFEVHSEREIRGGVVINPPTYIGWYTVPCLGHKRVPALLPHSTNVLIGNASVDGYPISLLIKAMGATIKAYSVILRKKLVHHEVLIIARQHSWQGAAAIFAATQLLKDGIPVSVFIVEPPIHAANWFGSKEEMDFVHAGGIVYRNIQDLTGRKFRVVVAAFENQYSGPKSILPYFGELLQHAVAILVDPPVLKCSYTTALQVATRDIIVVDGGISAATQLESGSINSIFPITNGPTYVNVVPVEFTVKGSRLHFYDYGRRVTQ